MRATASGSRGGASVRRRRAGRPRARHRPARRRRARRCQALRARGVAAPVLFLTARDALPDRLSGFHAGGDDYLTKPFALAELLVRVARARCRRAAAGRRRRGRVDLVLDPARHAIRQREREVPLTPTEFRMLAALAGAGRARSCAARRWSRPRGRTARSSTTTPSTRTSRGSGASCAAPARRRAIDDGARRRLPAAMTLPPPPPADVDADARGRSRRPARRRQRRPRRASANEATRCGSCSARVDAEIAALTVRDGHVVVRETPNDAVPRPARRGSSTARGSSSARPASTPRSTARRCGSGAAGRGAETRGPRRRRRSRAEPAPRAADGRHGGRGAVGRRPLERLQRYVLLGSLVLAALLLLAGWLAIRGAVDGALRPVAR